MSGAALGAGMGERRELIAAAMILGSGVCMSFLPVVVALTDNPMLFIGVMGIVKIAGILAFMVLWCPGLFMDKRVWVTAMRRLACWLMLIWFVGYYDLAAFAWAVRIIDPAVVMMVYQISPAIMVLWIERLFRGEGRYRRIGARGLAPFGLTAVGAICVIASQSGGFEGFDMGGALALGVGLALLAADLDTTSGVGFRWGADVMAVLPADVSKNRDAEIFCLLIGVSLCSFGGGFSWAVLGFMSGERLDGGEWILALIGGLIASALPTILWHWGNLLTSNLGVNVTRYFTPLLSLMWLLLLGMVSDVDLALLVAGAALIMGANMGMALWRR